MIKKIDRRDFMSQVMRITAIAAGLSVNEVRSLLASGDDVVANFDASVQQRYSIYQKSSDNEIKNLKVLIEDNKKVFESEYGRITPIQKVEDPKKPREYLLICRVEWGGSGSIIDTCQSHYGKGGTCGKLKKCGNNSCSGQKCPLHWDCGTHSCSGHECPKFLGCGSVTSSFKETFFDKYKSDPYVQHLFERFEVTSSYELANQVNDLIKMRV